MSHAFMKEGDEQSLEEISPSVQALSLFLTRENNGVRIVERRTYKDEQGNEIHVMSNGLSYKKNQKGRWEVA
ncbi:MAG TPA: hypothetical protein VG737_11095 [Cyclobacteriaceae bacterium]|nr:hypothetical protein [Cyclobacteriaceae bacterium]